MRMKSETLDRLREFFETLSADSVADIGRFYAPDAGFKDPFNDVRGVAAIERVFRHMFTQIDAPRFAVREIVAQGDQAFMIWDLFFRPKGSGAAEQRIHGASHLRFDANGQVSMHRDYWDAAEELYEKLPVIGSLMRFLKRRAAA